MIDFQQIYDSIHLAPGEKITIEINGRKAEMTAQGLTVKDYILKADALQSALTGAQIAREIRNQLVYPHPDAEEVKKLAEDLIHIGEQLKRWADQ